MKVRKANMPVLLVIPLLLTFLLRAPLWAQTIDFIGSAKSSFSSLMTTAVPFDEQLRHYETADGSSIDLDVYTSDKIEKIVFSSIHIAETGVWEESCFIYPAEGYEFPVFWANLTRFGDNINILIFDFLPLQDLVMSPEYGQTYLEPLNETKDYVRKKIIRFAMRDKAVEFSSMAMYTYSPYKMVARVAPHGAARIGDILDAYADTYLSLIDESQELSEGDARDYATEKHSTLRSLLMTNDPGYPFMIGTFGEEITLNLMEEIF
jgi:hypothetical protein